MKHISYSALKEWNDCAWKHKLNYIDGLKRFKGNEFTAFGTAIHTVCEHLVAHDITNGAQLFDKEFAKNLIGIKDEDPEIIFRKDLVESMRRQGAILIDHILPALRGTFSDFEVFSIEEDLYVPLEEALNFKGYIDLVIKTSNGKYHIIDWKTCSWGWDNRKKNDKMTTYQLTLYKHFWCEKHHISPTNVVTHFALLKRTAKYNQAEIFKVTSGARKTQNALKLLNKAVYNIHKGNFIKNKLSCFGRYGTCEYYKTQHCQ